MLCSPMSLEDCLYPLRRFYEGAPQPVKSVLGGAYRALPVGLRQGKRHSLFAAEARASARWSEQEIREYQITALRDSLLAANEAPFYRQRFAAAGVRPSEFSSLNHLDAYPLLSKQDVLHNGGQMVNPLLPSASRLHMTTGGSSGVPVGFELHKGVSRPKEQAYLEAQWGRRGWRPGDRTAVIRGAVTSGKASGSISYFDATRNWLVLSSYHLTPDRLIDYVAALNRFRPQHLHMYPSAALLLARGLEASGLKLTFPITSLLCGSEKLTAAGQRYLQQIFAAPVLHWYGHSERAVLAAQGTTSDRLYFWPGYGYVEFASPDADGLCEIIATSFHNHVMPLIRYRTGDYVHENGIDLGGGEFVWPSVDGIVGRGYEFLVSRTGRRISLTAINMHDRIFDGLLAVQFYQNTAGMVEVRLQPGSQWQHTRQPSIEAGLLAKLGDDFTLQFRVVDQVEKTVAGKHRWLITEFDATEPDFLVP